MADMDIIHTPFRIEDTNSELTAALQELSPKFDAIDVLPVPTKKANSQDVSTSGEVDGETEFDRGGSGNSVETNVLVAIISILSAASVCVVCACLKKRRKREDEDSEDF
jgi:hypothetical protein